MPAAVRFTNLGPRSGDPHVPTQSQTMPAARTCKHDSRQGRHCLAMATTIQQTRPALSGNGNDHAGNDHDHDRAGLATPRGSREGLAAVRRVGGGDNGGQIRQGLVRRHARRRRPAVVLPDVGMDICDCVHTYLSVSISVYIYIDM